ncbi:hypothetical protein [Trinickia sp. Y13]|uniref:hypothetical protein n=1 Tax=Trinickia sp. Y13 TaxID=2917807 RepID=UPI0024070046|nr:hypothetical protein [Trinickia sp. Y13]MDG0022727.1 hypothetical protein [Trinickia sp. Y13]
MREDKQLIVGAFYWVIREVDPESACRDEWEPGQEWLDEIQPARFNGWSASGEMLWNFMGFDGSSNWPVLWIGEEIEVPILAARPAVLQM